MSEKLLEIKYCKIFRIGGMINGKKLVAMSDVPSKLRTISL